MEEDLKNTMTVSPASPFLGADVTGISVALDQFLLLRFRQPALTGDEIVGFSNLFGTILSDRKNEEEMASV
ncbi:hypothetical protein [Sinorhizobium meliloti]|uniref:hypothetical protein n=1 Tax=Rhizobium meliloti TaxID=382 RepID=UPI000419842A|nr:hypothetical protein [Sinorhizobium meliloti]MDE4615957.1 hypothetical protein [Sinorhizobium meliloti]